jgi:hypothetical protein
MWVLVDFLIGMILFYFCCIWVKGRERDPKWDFAEM